MKYFCKKTQSICENKIKSDEKDTWITQGRFSLRYNSSGNFSLVKISNLSKEDAGKYLCPVDVPLNNEVLVNSDDFIDASLDVLEQGGFEHFALTHCMESTCYEIYLI